MIRRHVAQEYWLITQDAHARLSGYLARRLGNAHFQPPSTESAILGIELHDSGWPVHDDQPTLNLQHQPLDVFESPRSVAIRVWEASVENAMKIDPYAGLLVSLHALGLSVYAVEQGMLGASTWSLTDQRARFDINRFQHRMIEIQEMLRGQLGMRLDLPLTHGIAENSSEPAELQLKSDFNWLRAMDQLSLCICCTLPPFKTIGAMGMQIERVDARSMTLNPWPFAETMIETEFPFRRIPARPYADAVDLINELGRASIERFTVTLSQSRI